MNREHFNNTELNNDLDYNFNRYTEWTARGTEDSTLYKNADWKFQDPGSAVVLITFIAIFMLIPIALPIYLIYKYFKGKKNG